MLSTIDSRIKYWAMVPLKNCTAAILYEGIDNVIQRCNRNTIYVTSIESDWEFKNQFEPIEDNMDAKFNYAPQGQHVPQVERNNRTISDRIRTAVHYLPYRNIPWFLLKHIAVSETEKLNWFPAKEGLSDTFSPHQLMGLRPIDWHRDVKILQGSYVQAFAERTIKNDLKCRTLDAIFLAPLDNKQGEYLCLHLATNKVITSQKITQVPITNLVIKAVEELAQQDGMSALKIKNKTRTVVYNNDYVPGIDYEEYEEPVAELHDPKNRPRPQRDYNAELSNRRHYDPVDSSELDDLRADVALPANTQALMTTMPGLSLPLVDPPHLLPLQLVRAGVSNQSNAFQWTPNSPAFRLLRWSLFNHRNRN